MPSIDADRRTLLKTVGAGTTGLLAGCTGGDSGDDESDGSGGSSGSMASSGGDSTTSSSGGGDGDTLKIGAILPLSGPYANSGKDERRGIKMAVDQWNQNGGVNGKQVEVLDRDSETDSSTAVRKVKNLRSNQNVDAVTGVMSSSVSLALSDLSKELEIPFLAVGSATTKVTGTKCSQYYFRHYQNSHMNAMSGGQYAANNLGLNWAQISSDYAWGHDIRDIQQQILKDNDGTLVQSLLVPFGTTDFSSALNKVRAKAGQIDVLFLNLFGRDAINALKQAVNYGLKDQVNLFAAQQTVSQARALKPSTVEGTYAGLKYWPKLQSGSNQTFVDQYTSRYDTPPSSQSWSGFICAREIMAAWKRAGTTDPVKVTKQLEDHKYDNIIGEGGQWRGCDHQAKEPFFVAKGNGEAIYDGVADFEILTRKQPDTIMRACEETGCSFDA